MAMWITVLGVLSGSMFQPTQRACFLVKGISWPIFISWRGTCKRGRHKSLREMWRSFIQGMYWCGLGTVTLMCSLLWCYLIIRDVVLLQHIFSFLFHHLCLPSDFETNFDICKVLHHWKELCWDVSFISMKFMDQVLRYKFCVFVWLYYLALTNSHCLLY
jgi:hypothetical protein